MSKYFWGTGVMDAQAKPLPYETFADFVNKWLVTPVVCSTTSEQYAALDKAGKHAAKNTRWFSACSYKGDLLRRNYNVDQCHLLVLDVDLHEDAVRVLGAPFDDILPTNFVLWKTLTSAPEWQRVRLVVETEPLTPEQYVAGVEYLGELFGVAVNPESLKPANLWFAPTRHVNQQHISPIVASRLTGEPLRASTWAATPSDDDPLPIDTLPATDVTEADAEAMLATLSADCSYFQWVTVMCALKHQFGDAGLDLFDEWSANGAKYSGIDAIRDKWTTFRSRTRKPITIRSLIKLARAAGWRPSGARSLTDLEALIAAAPDLATLTGPVLHAIHDAPLLSPLDTDVLLGRLQTRSKALHAPVRASTLRTALAALDPPPAASTAVPSDLQGFVFVRESGLWTHPARGVRFSVHAFDNGFCRAVPDARPTPHALQALGLEAVDREGYEPRRPTEMIYTDQAGATVLNTYRCSHPEEDEARSDEAGEILQTHLRLLFPEERSRDLLLSWCSYCLTHPGEKVRFAVFIQGAPGCGKSLIAEALCACFGSTNSRKVDNTMVSEKFNSWISNTLFCFFEEILIGDRQRDLMERLKDLVTGETSNIRAMRTDAVERPNMLNCMFLSNHLHGLRLDRDDRRFFVLCCAQQHTSDVALIPREHFAALARLKGDLAGGLRHYLIHRTISSAFDSHGHAPETADRETVLRAGASEVDTAVQSVFDAGDNPLIAPDLCSSGEVIRAVRDEVRHTTAKQVGRVLLDMGFVRVGQRSIEDERHTIWHQPTVLVGHPWDVFKVRWYARNDV